MRAEASQRRQLKIDGPMPTPRRQLRTHGRKKQTKTHTSARNAQKTIKKIVDESGGVDKESREACCRRITVIFFPLGKSAGGTEQKKINSERPRNSKAVEFGAPEKIKREQRSCVRAAERGERTNPQWRGEASRKFESREQRDFEAPHGTARKFGNSNGKVRRKTKPGASKEENSEIQNL